ncbi:hypothetical protein [Salinactinospora qingdaonensis]|uniref:DUF4190 domain-containing protein n=1 Tax=Salinactinospora qingdaonensis TaxID=702744 RepID=A0ABP7G0H4_9ACTN
MTEYGGGRHGSPAEGDESSNQYPGSWFTPSSDRHRRQAQYQTPHEESGEAHEGRDSSPGAWPDTTERGRQWPYDPALPPEGTSGPYPAHSSYPGYTKSTGGYGTLGAAPGMAEPYPSALEGLGSPAPPPTGEGAGSSGAGGSETAAGMPPEPAQWHTGAGPPTGGSGDGHGEPERSPHAEPFPTSRETFDEAERAQPDEPVTAPFSATGGARAGDADRSRGADTPQEGQTPTEGGGIDPHSVYRFPTGGQGAAATGGGDESAGSHRDATGASPSPAADASQTFPAAGRGESTTDWRAGLGDSGGPDAQRQPSRDSPLRSGRDVSGLGEGRDEGAADSRTESGQAGSGAERLWRDDHSPATAVPSDWLATQQPAADDTAGWRESATGEGSGPGRRSDRAPGLAAEASDRSSTLLGESGPHNAATEAPEAWRERSGSPSSRPGAEPTDPRYTPGPPRPEDPLSGGAPERSREPGWPSRGSGDAGGTSHVGPAPAGYGSDRFDELGELPRDVNPSVSPPGVEGPGSDELGPLGRFDPSLSESSRAGARFDELGELPRDEERREHTGPASAPRFDELGELPHEDAWRGTERPEAPEPTERSDEPRNGDKPSGAHGFATSSGSDELGPLGRFDPSLSESSRAGARFDELGELPRDEERREHTGPASAPRFDELGELPHDGERRERTAPDSAPQFDELGQVPREEERRDSSLDVSSYDIDSESPTAAPGIPSDLRGDGGASDFSAFYSGSSETAEDRGHRGAEEPGEAMAGDGGTGSGNTWAFGRNDPRLPDYLRTGGGEDAPKRRDGSPEHTTQFVRRDGEGSGGDKDEHTETPLGMDSVVPPSNDPLGAIAAQQARGRGAEQPVEEPDELDRPVDTGAADRGQGDTGQQATVDELGDPSQWRHEPRRSDPGEGTREMPQVSSYADLAPESSSGESDSGEFGGDHGSGYVPEAPAAGYGDTGPDYGAFYASGSAEADAPTGAGAADSGEWRGDLGASAGETTAAWTPDFDYDDYGASERGPDAPAEYGYADDQYRPDYGPDRYDERAEPASSASRGRRSRSGRDRITEEFPGFQDEGAPDDEYPGYDVVEGWPETERLATATLWLGIAGLIPGIGLITSIVALVLAPRARRNIRRSQGELEGLTQVKAGVVMAWIGIALFVVGLAVGGGMVVGG